MPLIVPGSSMEATASLEEECDDTLEEIDEEGVDDWEIAVRDEGLALCDDISFVPSKTGSGSDDRSEDAFDDRTDCFADERGVPCAPPPSDGADTLLSLRATDETKTEVELSEEAMTRVSAEELDTGSCGETPDPGSEEKDASCSDDDENASAADFAEEADDNAVSPPICPMPESEDNAVSSEEEFPDSTMAGSCASILEVPASACCNSPPNSCAETVCSTPANHRGRNTRTIRDLVKQHVRIVKYSLLETLRSIKPFTCIFSHGRTAFAVTDVTMT